LNHRKLRGKEVTVENSNETLVMTPNEVRQLLKCSRGVLYTALRAGRIPSTLRAGRIPSIRISARKIIIPKAAFMKWLNGEGGNNLHPKQ